MMLQFAFGVRIWRGEIEKSRLSLRTGYTVVQPSLIPKLYCSVSRDPKFCGLGQSIPLNIRGLLAFRWCHPFLPRFSLAK